ncbi:MAG: hypothetical protein J7621_21495 [Niastella sp.]|nr:hypothetical protein [Niastella sp.]
MKNLFLSIVVLLTCALCMISCKKEIDQENNSLTNLVSDARRYFEVLEYESFKGFDSIISANQITLPRKHIYHWPKWENAEVQQFSNVEAIVVPIGYSKSFLLSSNLAKNKSYSINEIRKLFIYKVKNGDFKVEAVTYLPDSVCLQNKNSKFSGYILIEDWKGNFVTSYLVLPDGAIKKGMDRSVDIHNDLQITTFQSPTTICIYAEGYNYSAGDPEGVYWSELIRCETFFPATTVSSKLLEMPDYTRGGASSSGGGGNVNSVYNSFMIYSPDFPINDAQTYLNCFTNSPGDGYHYQISLCVSQPEPGSRTPWSGQNPFGDDKNPVYVGHTYLIITQITPTRTTVRNIGFYPANGATPYSPSDRGVFNNDQYRGYDIKLTITMTSSQFFSVLDFIKENFGSFQYNLNTNNCSTFAINALNRAGFSMPATRGVWHNGEGYNPGDLGEDIRSMSLPANMTRTTVYGSHPNQGICQ